LRFPRIWIRGPVSIRGWLEISLQRKFSLFAFWVWIAATEPEEEQHTKKATTTIAAEGKQPDHGHWQLCCCWREGKKVEKAGRGAENFCLSSQLSLSFWSYKMSLAPQLRDVGSKPNDAKYALYEAIADKAVASKKVPQILEVAKHRQKQRQKERRTSRLKPPWQHDRIHLCQERPMLSLTVLIICVSFPLPVCVVVCLVISVEGQDQYGRTYIVPELLNHLIEKLADPQGKQEVTRKRENNTEVKRRDELVRGEFPLLICWLRIESLLSPR
jgi:hypothetical protein